MNKLLIQILSISLIGVVIGVIQFFIKGEYTYIILNSCGGIFFLIGSYILIKAGTLIKSRFFPIIMFGVPVIIVGVMFKIMHWPGAAIMIVFGSSLIVLIYFIHFLSKKEKAWLDICKLLFIVIFVSGRCFKAMHWPLGDELTFLSFIVFLLMIGYAIQFKKVISR